MNKLMMMINGSAMRYMAEEDGNGGEGGGTGGQGGSTGGDGNGGAGGDGGTGAQGGEGGGTGDQPKPFLGGDGKGGTGGQGGQGGQQDGKGGDGKGGTGDQPEPATEEDFLKAIKCDEKVLGRNDIELNSGLIKACVPWLQKNGVKPEAANELANLFAKAQMDAVREAYKERCSFFEKANKAAQEKYDDKGFAQINRAIDAKFKKGGIMNNVIRNSELGCDPEFLALMYEIGASLKEDTGAGAAAGAGEGSGDPNGIEGLAKMW